MTLQNTVGVLRGREMIGECERLKHFNWIRKELRRSSVLHSTCIPINILRLKKYIFLTSFLLVACGCYKVEFGKNLSFCKWDCLINQMLPGCVLKITNLCHMCGWWKDEIKLFLFTGNMARRDYSFLAYWTQPRGQTIFIKFVGNRWSGFIWKYDYIYITFDVHLLNYGCEAHSCWWGLVI